MYNPAIDAPKNQEQLEICVNYYLAIEQEKVAADPTYQPKTREDLMQMYSIFIQPEPEPEPVLTTEELFAQLRSIREVKLAEYDVQVAQLLRDARLGKDVSAKLAAWDNYATELVKLTDPDREGSPWDGGGPETPWPVMP